VVLRLWYALELPGKLLGRGLSDCIGPEWGAEICISSRPTGKADEAGLGNYTLRVTALEKLLSMCTRRNT